MARYTPYGIPAEMKRPFSFGSIAMRPGYVCWGARPTGARRQSSC